MELNKVVKPAIDPDEAEEEGEAESGDMSALQARLEKIEKHLGLDKKPKSADEILRARKRA